MKRSTLRKKKLCRWLFPDPIGPVDVGFFLTIAIFLAVEWAAFQPASNPTQFVNKFDEFAHMKPSEMGDAMAGVFAALAFVWIIVTVFLQSIELREQRKEFRGQRKATQDMARSMKAQAEIFKDEQRQRKEQEARELLDELISGLRMSIENEQSTHWTVKLRREPSIYLSHKVPSVEEESSIRPFRYFRKEHPNKEKFFRAQHEKLGLFCERIEEHKSEGRVLQCPSRNEALGIQLQASRILELLETLSEAQKERVQNLKIVGIEACLANLLRQDIWAEQEEETTP